MNIPRPEYPRPQFVRTEWLCLNGPWQFEIDHGDSGLQRGLRERELTGKIVVPFCPESSLSGIGNTDFMNAVWYRREVELPARWSGQRILLHFQAVDCDATVWVNGVEVGRHRGGFTPFSCDLSGIATAGETVIIVVRARDGHAQPQPRGKQSQRYENYSCYYTRTTGIWQTVWLEPVPMVALARPRLTPEVGRGRFRLEQGIQNCRPGLTVRATVLDAQGVISVASQPTGHDFQPRLDLDIPGARRRLWSPSDPHLYDIDIELLDEAGEIVDRAATYCGLRGICIDGKAIRINGEIVFQRLVLDQGYYHDGIMTAPSDDALKADIEMSLAVGFNGARLHQKVFEERFLYHADRLGYLCWGEFGDWGCRELELDRHHQRHVIAYATQWQEAIERDYSHPCIIGWCPLNETTETVSDEITDLDDATRALFLATKAIDSTRPVLDTSGYSHRVAETDVFDCHDYAQDIEQFRLNHAQLGNGKPFYNGPSDAPINTPYAGQPFFVSEFGGVWWSDKDKAERESWGYGNRPATLEEFYQRFEGLCNVLLDHPLMFGYCYTQLTDVYLEENGFYTFERKPKFDLNRVRAVQARRAAIEQEL